MIHFACPRCHRALKSRHQQGGKRGTCPACKSPVLVPLVLGPLVPVGGLAASPAAMASADEDGQAAWEQEARRRKTRMLGVSLLAAAAVCAAPVLACLFLARPAKPLQRAAVDRRPAERTPPPAAVQPPTAQSAQGPDLPEPDLGDLPEAASSEDPLSVDPPSPIVPDAGLPKSNQPPPAGGPSASLPQEKPEAAPRKEPAGEPGAAKNQDADALVAVLARDLTSRQVCKRFKATRGLAVLGPPAKAASRALCQALLDRSADVRLGAAAALKKVNPTLYQWVIPLLVDPEPNNHAEPLNQLMRLGREGNPAVPVLLDYQQQYGGPAVIEALAAVAANDGAVTARFAAWLAKATDGTTRLAIARALPHMADGRGRVGALVLAVRTDRWEPVRVAAAHALGELGRDARAAQGALTRLQTDPSAAVREAAAKALEKVQDDR